MPHSPSPMQMELTIMLGSQLTPPPVSPKVYTTPLVCLEIWAESLLGQENVLGNTNLGGASGDGDSRMDSSVEWLLSCMGTRSGVWGRVWHPLL